MSIESTKKSGMEYWVKVIMIFFSGWVVIWTYRTVLTPIYDQIKVSLGLTSHKEIAYLSMVFYIFYTAFQIPSGLLADRFGRKRIVTIAFCIFAMGMLVLSYASDLTTALIGVAFVGIGQSAYFGCAYSITNSAVSKDKRGFSSAIVNCGCAIGMAVGLIGSSYFVDTMGVDWHIILRVMAGLAIMMAIIFATGLKKDEVAISANDLDEKEKGQFVKVLKKPKIIAAFLLYFATCYGYYMIINWLPAFLQDERDVHGVMVGYIASVVAFASIPGALSISKVSDRLASKRIQILVILEVLSAVTLFMAIHTSQMVTLIIALICYGLIGKMAVDPILVAYVVEFAPKATYSRVLAFLNFSGMMGSILTTYTTAALADKFGTLAIGFYIACVLLIITTIILILVNNAQKKTTMDVSKKVRA